MSLATLCQFVWYGGIGLAIVLGLVHALRKD
jgi:hypothetical protein